MENEPATGELLERKFKEHGLRMTGLRRCILAILVESVEHLTVLDIIERVLSTSLNTNVASIYRNMLVFESIGIVKSHTVQTPQVYYEVAGSVPDHFIDLHTGKAVELHHKALGIFKTAIVEQYGYRQEECYMRLYAYPIKIPTDSSGQDKS
ncbi:MAG: hypothetical protein COA71_00125 [SAR86 cluster bacterium]|uniref:Transcriptional repressor n=1 Tax=SAR86 cluster bacterium TaxID=2030880 RepID=A0A2A5CHU3_9GAMM|nr:MAG: hypothetical protein COA71_00125 [SAR86 cluster bacterium]